jgi:RNA-binding protein
MRGDARLASRLRTGIATGPKRPLRGGVYDFPLSGAQKSFLRGVGQKLDARLKLGRGGVTPAFLTELQRLLRAHELVKLRFVGADRDERAALCVQVADEGRCVCVGAVGHTALFYRQHPEPDKRAISLP